MNLIDSLDKNMLVQILTRSIGFNEIPVSIHTFMYDDYYLGAECGLDNLTGLPKTYKIWEDALEEIFPDPITTNTFVALNGAIGCVHGSTEIMLTDNTKHKIADMFKHKDKYIGKYVYSYDTIKDSVCAGKIKDVHCTGIKETVTVKFLNKKDKSITEIRCTPDHKFLLSDGYYKRADELKPNDRIESLYAVKFRDYYRTSKQTRMLHLNIAKSIFNKLKGYDVHHINENKLDNTPTNLELLTPSQHHRIHYTERNLNLSIRQDKLLKLSYVICEEFGKKLLEKDISVDEVNDLRSVLVNRGYINKHSPKFATIDEFTESIDYIIKNNLSYDYKSEIKKNLENLRTERAIITARNKSGITDITINDIIKIAKKIRSYKVPKIAEQFECSNSKIRSVIYSKYDSIEDFATDLGFDYQNHKVISVTRNKKCKVYDLTVEKYHNYGIIDSSSKLGEKFGLIFTHNTGKSRTAKVMMAYQLHKILCTKDFYSYNELNEYNKPHVFFFGHTDKYKAKDNMEEFIQMLHDSPYFEEQFNDPDSYLNTHIMFVSGREPGDFIGKNLVCAWI